jgi:thioredoxin reductase
LTATAICGNIITVHSVNMHGTMAGRAPAARVGGARKAFGVPAVQRKVQSRGACLRVFAIKDGAKLDRKLRVAVVGGGPSGACTAETLAAGGVETVMIERKMDNCKVRRC